MVSFETTLILNLPRYPPISTLRSMLCQGTLVVDGPTT
jgi:hypothetical protein